MKRLTWQNYDMCQFCGEGACCEHYCDNTFPVCDDKAIYDRLAAIEDILGDEYDLDELKEMVQANIPRLIDEQPTIDAVPVVRCRECRHYPTAKVNEKGFLICPASGMEITETDYCSYGERMDKEDET